MEGLFISIMNRLDMCSNPVHNEAIVTLVAPRCNLGDDLHQGQILKRLSKVGNRLVAKRQIGAKSSAYKLFNNSQ